MPSFPVRYTPSLEKPEKDEEQIANDIVETMQTISKKTYEDSGHAVRSVHAKGHALLHGELQVPGGLPDTLIQGMFTHAGRYPVIMRFSTSPGDMLSDRVSTPRGVAIKVLDVPGARLTGAEDANTQDFLMVNGPAFLTPNAKAFLANLKLLAKTTNKAEGAKEALSTVLRGTEKVIEALGGKSGKLKSLGGEPATHPLGETYFTQVPMLYGAYMAKISIAPISPELKQLKGKKVDIEHNPDILRDEMTKFFARHGGEWELRVQLCTDIETMPIEDATVVWPEEKSPFIAVARIVVPPQEAWNKNHSSANEDRISFSPWHGLAAHRPIGSVMRVRKLAYEKSAQFRAAHNHKTVKEPRAVEDIFYDSSPQAGVVAD